MSNDMYYKYINFLKEHELYDKKTFEYIKRNSVMIDYSNIEEITSIDCSIVLDEKERLVQVIPCVPFLKNDDMVAINIFIYIRALMLIPNIGRRYDERYYNKLLPFLFVKLYMLENKNTNLLNFEKKLMFILLQTQEINGENTLIDCYFKDKNKLNNSARKLKRKTKNYLYNKFN